MDYGEAQWRCERRYTDLCRIRHSVMLWRYRTNDVYGREDSILPAIVLICTMLSICRTPLHAQISFEPVRIRAVHEAKAEELQGKSDFLGAINEIRLAQLWCRDTSMYAMQMADLFRMKKDTVQMFDYIELALKSGWALHEFTHEDEFFAEIVRNAPCPIQLRLFQAQETTRSSATQWKAELDLLGETDQWVRRNFNKGQEAVIDSMNYARLEALTKMAGRYIPSRGSLLVLLHTLDSDAKYVFWGPLLDQALIDGDIDSESYALIVDRCASLSGRPQIYGTDSVIDTSIAENPMSRFNAARARIGLPAFP